MRWQPRPLITGVATGFGGLVALSILSQQLFRLQARMARRLIGKPLGEVAHEGDKTYKKKYGDRSSC